jgi:hypothetical protein
MEADELSLCGTLGRAPHIYLTEEKRVSVLSSRGQLKCDGTRAETRFPLSVKWTGPFKSAGASVQSTTGSRCVRISGSNAGYTMFRGSVKDSGYPLHSPVSPLLPLPCVTVCHHISNGVYVQERSNTQGLTWSLGISKSIGLLICYIYKAL